MRVLMRNTVFRTATLTGLFSCLLALAGAFSGITVPVHAITAAEVKTEATLKQFVEEAVDAFYIDFLIRNHCDFSNAPFSGLIPPGFLDLPTGEMKQFISLAGSVGIGAINVADYCEEDKILSFGEVFRLEEGDWKSGPIYLFVIDDNRKMLFHGADENLEDEALEAFDAGGRDVAQLIIDEVKTPTDNNGLVSYCWDDPTVEDDDIGDNNPLTAPGNSWKVSYVVDPFEYLQLEQPLDSPGIIFSSGIYPKTGEPPSGCQIVTGMEEPVGGDGGETPPTDVSSGGGCAIAAGSVSTPRGTAFNLLLIVSALFFTISFKSRAMDKRNGVRS